MELGQIIPLKFKKQTVGYVRLRSDTRLEIVSTSDIDLDPELQQIIALGLVQEMELKFRYAPPITKHRVV